MPFRKTGIIKKQDADVFYDLLKKTGIEVDTHIDNIKTRSAELSRTIQEPPERPTFPKVLFSTFLIVEVLDLVIGLGSELTVIGAVIYDILRIFGSVYIRFWAWKRINSNLRLTALRRGAIKIVLRGGLGLVFFIITIIANAPIPILGAIAQAFPTDIFFILSVHFGYVKYIDKVTATIEEFKKMKFFIDTDSKITRRKGSGGKETRVTTSASVKNDRGRVLN